MPNTTPAPFGVPDTLTTTAPERIWLQIDTYGDPNNRSAPFPQDGDVTWCRDSVGGVEVGYVRADLASAAQPPIAYAPPSPTLGVAPSGPGTSAALAAAGEEIMVNTPYDVFTLPLRPSGLSSGPRFVVHVPGPEQPAADQFIATFRCENNGVVGTTTAKIHSVSRHDDGVIEVVIDHWPEQHAAVDGALRAEVDALTARLGDIYQIADAALAREDRND